MGPYSHIIIAGELETFIKPDNVLEYYWGAVAPDVRYLMKNMPRKQTHVSEDKILSLMQRYPKQKDFLQGYFIHCISDKIDIKRIIQKRFPFSLVKKRITKNNCTLILEFFNVEILKPFKKTFSGENNPVLGELGIGNREISKFSKEIDNYLKTLSSESSFLLYQNLGFVSDGRIERYRKLDELWQESFLKKNLKFFSPQLKKVNQDIASLVKQHLSKLYAVELVAIQSSGNGLKIKNIK
jgi:hypothetical protein